MKIKNKVITSVKIAAIHASCFADAAAGAGAISIALPIVNVATITRNSPALILPF